MSSKADDLYTEFCRMVWANLDQEGLQRFQDNQAKMNDAKLGIQQVYQ